MKNKIYNELGISLVLGKGNWIGLSHEIEIGENETRKLGWKKVNIKNIKDIYIRIWLFKIVLIISTTGGIKIFKKDKYALKLIIGFKF